jgi:hypothetical protein
MENKNSTAGIALTMLVMEQRDSSTVIYNLADVRSGCEMMTVMNFQQNRKANDKRSTQYSVVLF